MTHGRKKKYLLIATHYCPVDGGALTVYDALAEEMAKSESNASLSVLTSRHLYLDSNKLVAGYADFDRAAPYKIYRTGPLVPASDVKPGKVGQIAQYGRMLWAILKAHMQEDFDGFIIAPIHHTGWLAPFLKRVTKKPVLAYVHGEEAATYALKPEGRQFPMGLTADRVLVVSNFTADLVEQLGVERARIKLLPNAVDAKRVEMAAGGKNWREAFGLDKSDMIIASAGRLVHRKGFDFLVEAFKQLQGKHENIHLVIAGGGELEAELREQAGQSNGRIHIAGRISNEDLNSLYRDADIFAMPNRTMQDGDTEGFGLVFLEAGLFATPSLAGNAGGAPDAVLNEKTGLLCDSQSIEAIKNSLERLITDQPLRERLGEAAKAHAFNENWSTRAKQLFAIIQEAAISD